MGEQEELVSYYPINFENIVQPKDDAKEAYENVADLELDNVAVAGHAYDVNVIVYGLQEVKIEVTMTQWEQNGSINLDPESDYEYKISLGAEDDAHDKAHPLAMEVGATHQIEAVTTPALASGVGFSYKSKDTGIATVSETGLITAVAPGLVRIDVYVPAYDATAGVGDPKRPEGGYTAMWVQVSEATPPTAITVNPAAAVVNKTFGDADFELGDATASVDGATLTYEVTAGGEFLTKAANTEKTFQILGAGEATITITAHKDGNYTDGTATVTVNIAKADQNFTLNATEVAISKAASLPATVSVTDVAGPGAISVSVEGGNGHVNAAYDAGVITITVTDDVLVDGTDNCTVHVTKAGNSSYNELVKNIAVTIVD